MKIGPWHSEQGWVWSMREYWKCVDNEQCNARQAFKRFMAKLLKMTGLAVVGSPGLGSIQQAPQRLSATKNATVRFYSCSFSPQSCC